MDKNLKKNIYPSINLWMEPPFYNDRHEKELKADDVKIKASKAFKVSDLLGFPVVLKSGNHVLARGQITKGKKYYLEISSEGAVFDEKELGSVRVNVAILGGWLRRLNLLEGESLLGSSFPFKLINEEGEDLLLVCQRIVARGNYNPHRRIFNIQEYFDQSSPYWRKILSLYLDDHTGKLILHRANISLENLSNSKKGKISLGEKRRAPIEIFFSNDKHYWGHFLHPEKNLVRIDCKMGSSLLYEKLIDNPLLKEMDTNTNIPEEKKQETATTVNSHTFFNFINDYHAEKIFQVVYLEHFRLISFLLSQIRHPKDRSALLDYFKDKDVYKEELKKRTVLHRRIAPVIHSYLSHKLRNFMEFDNETWENSIDEIEIIELHQDLTEKRKLFSGNSAHKADALKGLRLLVNGYPLAKAADLLLMDEKELEDHWKRYQDQGLDYLLEL